MVRASIELVSWVELALLIPISLGATNLHYWTGSFVPPDNVLFPFSATDRATPDLQASRTLTHKADLKVLLLTGYVLTSCVFSV